MTAQPKSFFPDVPPAITGKAANAQHFAAAAAPPAAQQAPLAAIDGGKSVFAEANYDSSTTFGIVFGRTKSSKPIKGYTGFTADHGVPAIDPNYQFGDVARDFLVGMAFRDKIYLHGPTGAGKTTLGEQVAARTGRPFCRIQMHGEMEPVELTGSWVLNERGAMEYMPAALPKALTMPGIICFDEYDSGNPIVTAMVNAVLEGKPFILNNLGGKKVVPHKDCMFIATGNTKGLGDDTGLYNSTTAQSFATMDRFSMILTVDYMTETEERALIAAHHPTMPEPFVRQIAQLTAMIRSGYVNGQISVPISVRKTLAWSAKFINTGEIRRSFDLSFGNILNTSDKAVVDQLYQRVFS